jgi:hypothetical protein
LGIPAAFLKEGDMPRPNVAKLKTKAGTHGGKRRNAGRKRSEVVEFRRTIEEKIEDAEYAFAYMVGVMRDPRSPRAVRMTAAEKVLNRVLGTPKQAEPANANINVTHSADDSFATALRKVYGPIADQLELARGVDLLHTGAPGENAG